MIKRTSTIYGSQATLSHILGAYTIVRQISTLLLFYLFIALPRNLRRFFYSFFRHSNPSLRVLAFLVLSDDIKIVFYLQNVTPCGLRLWSSRLRVKFTCPFSHSMGFFSFSFLITLAFLSLVVQAEHCQTEAYFNILIMLNAENGYPYTEFVQWNFDILRCEVMNFPFLLEITKVSKRLN